MTTKVKQENEYMKTIKNPLYKFLYGIIKFHFKKILIILLVTTFCLVMVDINIKKILVDLIMGFFE